VIVQLSDLHLGAAGLGDPVADLRAAVRAVRSLRPAPDAVLVTGDLAEHGEAAEYALARDLLAELGVPVHVLAGNHDARAALRAAFPVPGGPRDPYRWAARLGPLRVVACDSTAPGPGDGRLDTDALAWLDAELARAPGMPTVVAMHHAPLVLGVPEFDALGLPAADRAALAAVLERHPHVGRVACGHVHMTVHGRVGPVPVSSAPSTWRDRLAPGPAGWEPVRGAAELVVHALVDGALLARVDPVR
jgi:3',5'-cyclic-AMP phosphodiesterase